MSKTLIIVHSLYELKKLELYFETSVDLLALTPDVMFELDQHGINYLTIEDLYSQKKYFQDIYLFNRDLENLLRKLDIACENFLKIPFAYSGNSQYFFTWFDDLLYLEKLIQIISNKYSKLYLFSHSYPEKMSWNKFKYSELISHPFNGTVSLPLERNIKRDIKIIYDALDVELILDSKKNSKNVPTIKRINAFYKRLTSYRKKLIIKYKEKQKNNPKNNNIIIVQDGYEVKALMKYLPEFNHLNPIASLRGKLNTVQLDNIEYDLIEGILTTFTNKEFVLLKRYIELLITSYHKEIVGRVGYYKKIVNHCLEYIKPKVLFFSIGIRDVFDMIIAHAANEKNIPVVFFQHGGSLSFFNPMYQRYVELTPNIKKTIVINSINELETSKHQGSKCLPIGSILRYEMFHEENQYKDKEVLFIAGPLFESSSYRYLLNNSSCSDMYQSCCDILSVIDDNLLSVDVKLSPCDQDNAYSFFDRIIQTNLYQKTGIIYGLSAEDIFKRYQLIILDYLGSALVTYLLTSKVEIILYLKNFDILKISDKSKDDLLNRCHIAKNVSELDNLLSEYQAGNLKSKWNLDFINQYVYPVENGNPGENIANYIKSIV
jgi:hypothetical protein